ncbi:MAG: hypothetical protein HW389_1906 [Bacteroidetes bacterium]|nr:hypothetical protein [Bacteroidota bacterium]
MSLISKKSPEARFWHWFGENESRMFNFERNQEQNLGDLLRELHRINHSMTFEIGSETEGKREFIISADGKREAFPAVIGLAEAAPTLPRWRVVKFRPRRTNPCLIGIGDLEFSSDDVLATLEQEGMRIGVSLFLGDASHFDDKIVGHIGFLLLDYTLGEYDVEKLVGTVSFHPKERSSRLTKLPLRDLPLAFDQLTKSFSN